MILHLDGVTSHNAFRIPSKPAKKTIEFITKAKYENSSTTKSIITLATGERVTWGPIRRYKNQYKLKDITEEYINDPDVNGR